MSVAISTLGRFAAALLAGGRSSRMGMDKARLEWGGEPLWKVQLRKLEALKAGRLLVSCRKEQELEMDGMNAEWVFDPPDNPGPLGAIVTCLETAALPLLVLAVDMPGMTVEFLNGLLGEMSDDKWGVVCRSARGFEPLAAIYPMRALPTLRNQLVKENFKMQTALELLCNAGMMRARELSADEVPLFRNANTPEEYAAWKNPEPQA